MLETAEDLRVSVMHSAALFSRRFATGVRRVELNQFVTQHDSNYEPRGRRFESCRARQVSAANHALAATAAGARFFKITSVGICAQPPRTPCSPPQSGSPIPRPVVRGDASRAMAEEILPILERHAR